MRGRKRVRNAPQEFVTPSRAFPSSRTSPHPDLPVGPTSPNQGDGVALHRSGEAPQREGGPEKRMPPNEFGLRLLHPFRLYPHQKDAVAWMLAQEREQLLGRGACSSAGMGAGMMLAMEMGLGKTLCAANLLASPHPLQPPGAKGGDWRDHQLSLYICPRNLLATVRNDLRKFFGGAIRLFLFHRDFHRGVVLDRDLLERAAHGWGDAPACRVVLSTYGMVASEARRQEAGGGPGVFEGVRWKRVVLDESHEVRNRSTRRSAGARRIPAWTRVCMTGTPIQNSLTDLFVQLEVCGLGLVRPGQGGARGDRGLAAFEASGLVHRVRFVEAKDVEDLGLPEKTRDVIRFDLSRNEQVLHDSFFRYSAEEIETPPPRDGGPTRWKPAYRSPVVPEEITRFLRAMQVCSGILRPTTPPFENTKMSCFVETVAGLLGPVSKHRKVVVFANFRRTLLAAKNALDQARPEGERCGSTVVCGRSGSGVVRDRMFQRFRQDPRIRVLFMPLKLGSVGLNLTEASAVVFLEPWYNRSIMMQGEARVHRIGQIHPVRVVYLVARNSIEEKILEISEGKRLLSRTISEFFEAAPNETDVDPLDVP